MRSKNATFVKCSPHAKVKLAGNLTLVVDLKAAEPKVVSSHHIQYFYNLFVLNIGRKSEVEAPVAFSLSSFHDTSELRPNCTLNCQLFYSRICSAWLLEFLILKRDGTVHVCWAKSCRITT